jgi:hypothetical protein
MASDEPQPSPKRPWWKPSSWLSVFRRKRPLPDPAPHLPPRKPQQPVTWVPDPVWQPQPMQRNAALLDTMPGFVPPPMEPPSPANANVPDEEIKAAFREVSRCQAELSASMERLRSAVSASPPEIGPGHNQGPSLEDLDEVDEWIALLKDEGPRVKTAVDAKALIEQTEKVKRLPERIWNLLKAAGLLVLGVGVHEVTKDLTAPLWDNVAHKIVDLCHAIEVWVSLLPPM